MSIFTAIGKGIHQNIFCPHRFVYLRKYVMGRDNLQEIRLHPEQQGWVCAACDKVWPTAFHPKNKLVKG